MSGEEGEATRFDAAYFDALYTANADPWNFLKSRYEQRKYKATVAALGRRRFKRGLEIGCSIGLLTRMLAKKVEALTALDISAAAIEAAKVRNTDLSQVTFLADGFLQAELAPPYDLILFSEVLYYLTPDELAAASARTLELLESGGEVLIVSWLGKGHHPLSGDEATDGFIEGLGPAFRRIGRVRKKRYRMDHLRRE